MNRFFLKTIIAFTLIAILTSCATVPITGRQQINLFPEDQMIATSLTQYDQFLKTNKVSTNAKQTAMIKRVGHRIANAVEKYLTEHGLSDRVKNFKWEFNLVENDTPNAWCMPGGKVVFYTGILPYCKTETGVAVVMGHEIAHAIARHGNERISQQQGLATIQAGLQIALKDKPAETKQIWNTAFGVGAKFGVMLPFSRSHESEADKMGLVFMSMAGYQPAEAVEFWKRMGKSGGQKPPEFLSTHPADATRVKDLQAFLPEAMKYYKK